MEYNQMAFTIENMEQGLHVDLLNYLINYHKNGDDRFNDIHITSDGECLIIEWTLVPYDRSYGGGFKFVDDDCMVVREQLMPDHSYEYFPATISEKDALREWLNVHPGWRLNEFGIWTHVKDDFRNNEETDGE